RRFPFCSNGFAAAGFAATGFTGTGLTGTGFTGTGFTGSVFTDTGFTGTGLATGVASTRTGSGSAGLGGSTATLPIETLPLNFAPSSAGTGVASLLAGRLLLKVTHPNVAVECCAIVNLQSADLDVAAQPRVLAEGQLVARGNHALDLSLERHIGALEQSFDVGA